MCTLFECPLKLSFEPACYSISQCLHDIGQQAIAHFREKLENYTRIQLASKPTEKAVIEISAEPKRCDSKCSSRTVTNASKIEFKSCYMYFIKTRLTPQSTGIAQARCLVCVFVMHLS